MMIARSPQTVSDFLRNFVHFDSEEVWVLSLNSRGLLIQHKMLSKGTIDSVEIHPRDIFHFILRTNGVGFVLAHTHPSGDPKPSQEDIKFTRLLNKNCKFLELTLIDHLILSTDSYYSFEMSRVVSY